MVHLLFWSIETEQHNRPFPPTDKQYKNIVHLNTTTIIGHVNNEKKTSNDDSTTVCSWIILDVHWIGKLYLLIVSQTIFGRTMNDTCVMHRIYYVAYDIYI